MFAKPAWAMLLGSPQPQTRRTSRAVAITAPFGASPHPHASEGAERWVLWRVSTQDEPRLWANLLAVHLLLLIQNSYRML